MAKHFLLIGLAFVVGGSAVSFALAPGKAEVMGPREAIKLADYAAPRAVPGTFRMLVRDTGWVGRTVYFSSEYQNRDPRNLIVRLDRSTTEALARRLGSQPDKYFRDKWIEVRGEAERTTLGAITERAGKSSDWRYTQTTIRVTDPDQIVLADPPSS